MSTLLGILKLSKNGTSWVNWMDEDCKRGLAYIEEKLGPLWSCGGCHPPKSSVMMPLMLMPRRDLKLVVICKEPYDDESMATGIPVDTGGILDTPSSDIFRRLISTYWDNVDKDKFMLLYYESGILVVNSSFTKQKTFDKKYSMTDSHYPLWTNFTVPFIRKLAAEKVPIVALGLEGKLLTREIVPGELLTTCTFPSDRISRQEFISTLGSLMRDYVFDLERPLQK